MKLHEFFVVELRDNEHLIRAFNETDDGDDYGNVMGWWFATAHVLHHLDECPSEWDYNHGLCMDYNPTNSEDFTEQELQYLMADDLVTVTDLIEFGITLFNAYEVLKDLGRDY